MEAATYKTMAGIWADHVGACICTLTTFLKIINFRISQCIYAVSFSEREDSEVVICPELAESFLLPSALIAYENGQSCPHLGTQAVNSVIVS